MAKLLLSIVLVALVAATSALPRNPRLWPVRIVGGTEATRGKYPHQVSMQYRNSHICGGSIYDENTIVTAAHCADAASGHNTFSVVVGVHNIDNPEASAVVHQLTSKIIHPQYASSTTDYDVAILKLATPIVFGEYVKAIELCDQEAVKDDTATVTGWGTTSSGGSSPSTLRTVDVPIESRDLCNTAYGAGRVTDRMICAGLPDGGKDSCQGDSGGPLTVNGKLAGIVSWGRGCAQRGYPGVYSNVDNLRAWIEANSA